LAGDYMMSIRATSRGENASSQFRITVSTSTVWGMAGAGVIGIALLLMLGAVARFGPMSDTQSNAVTTANDIVIAARNLTKRYSEVSVVVDAINFDILKGEVFGLLGPNGKTTTILMMLGLTDISSGTASVLGYDPAHAAASQAQGRLSARLRRLL
jgi:ABC-type glutathione transport system ATPase component